MWTYRAPVADMAWLMHPALDAPSSSAAQSAVQARGERGAALPFLLAT